MSTSKYTDILLSTGLEIKDNMNGFEFIKSVAQNAINPNCTYEALDMSGVQINVDIGVLGKRFILDFTFKEFNSGEGQCLRLQIHPPHDCKIVGRRLCILC